MEPINILLILLLVGGFGGLFWFLRKTAAPQQGAAKWQEVVQENADLKARLEVKIEEGAKLESELEAERSEKDQLEGKGKQLFAEITGAREENKNLRSERDELKGKITKFETERGRQEKEFLRLSEQLEHARQKLTEEQERVKREDEEKLQQEREEWDRIWNDHEISVLSRLKEVCQTPSCAFTFYENTKLPESFDGSLKPDFLVEFLGQYIIFDAKKSKDLGNYLNDQVKKTMEKIKKSPSYADIYPTIFFVVPAEELRLLKKTFFYEDGFSFYIVSIEALEAILAAYRRITDYEKISEFDPQDREKIVDLIARYDRHISFQNAASILLAKEGLNVMSSKENITGEILDEVDIKKRNMRQPKLNEADLKRLSQSFEEQDKETERMIAPKEAISKRDLEEVQKALL